MTSSLHNRRGAPGTTAPTGSSAPAGPPAPPTVSPVTSAGAMRAARIRFLATFVPLALAASGLLALYVVAVRADFEVADEGLWAATVIAHALLALFSLRFGRQLGLKGGALSVAAAAAAVPVITFAAGAALAIRSSRRLAELPGDRRGR